MTAREKMREFREDKRLSFHVLSKMSGVSERLLGMVEDGDVTHPKIAEKIAKAYKLTKEEMYELMPPNHRPGHSGYDPDKYKSPVDMEQRVFNVVPKDMEKKRLENEYRNYQHDFHEKLRRRYG